MPDDSQENKRSAAEKPVTAAYLERAAVFYLGRYGSSAANLRSVLIRKAQRRAGRAAGTDAGILAWIDEVVTKAIRSGLVDDGAYAGAKLGSLLRRGASASTARAALASKGVAPETIASALAAAAPDELAQARRHAERKRLGPWRRQPDPSRRSRDLAALGRAGFPYRVAVAALDGDPE